MRCFRYLLPDHIARNAGKPPLAGQARLPAPSSLLPAAEVARRHQLQFPEHGAVLLRHLAAPMPLDVAHPQQPGAGTVPAFFPAFDGDRIIGGCCWTYPLLAAPVGGLPAVALWQRPGSVPWVHGIAAPWLSCSMERRGWLTSWLTRLVTCRGPSAPIARPLPPHPPPDSCITTQGRASLSACLSLPDTQPVARSPSLLPADVLPNGAGVMRAECEAARGQKRGREAAAPSQAPAAAAQPPKQQQAGQGGKGQAAAAAATAEGAAPSTEGPQRKRRRRGSNGEEVETSDHRGLAAGMKIVAVEEMF